MQTQPNTATRTHRTHTYKQSSVSGITFGWQLIKWCFVYMRVCVCGQPERPPEGRTQKRITKKNLRTSTSPGMRMVCVCVMKLGTIVAEIWERECKGKKLKQTTWPHALDHTHKHGHTNRNKLGFSCPGFIHFFCFSFAHTHNTIAYCVPLLFPPQMPLFYAEAKWKWNSKQKQTVQAPFWGEGKKVVHRSERSGEWFHLALS